VKRVRAGVIGLGVGEQHIAGYRLHPECEVTAVADIDPEKRVMARERYPELQVFDDANALLESAAVDVVSVASFDGDHFDHASRAIAAGKHIFVEKPLCQTANQLAKLRAGLALRPGLRMSSNLILRLSPRFLDLKRRIDAGELGRLFHVEADYNYGRVEKITTGWRSRERFYSVMLGGGIHILDLLIWLTSDRIVAAAAYGSRIATSGTAFRFDDTVVAILQWESGMTGKVAANFACVYPHFHKLVIYGTEATFENREDCGLLWRSRDRSEPPLRLDTPYPGVAKGALIPSFIDAILGFGRPLVDEAAVFQSMSACLAIERSLSQRAPVSCGWSAT
jgi:predicted dehydrogenase